MCWKQWFCANDPDVEMIEFLLLRNANTEIEDDYDRTPLDTAYGYRNHNPEKYQKVLSLFNKYQLENERLNQLPPPYKSPAQIEEEKRKNFEIKELSFKEDWYKQASGKYYTSADKSFTFSEFIDREVNELGNYTIEEVKGWMEKYHLGNNTKCIWVSPDPKVAYSYAIPYYDFNEAEKQVANSTKRDWKDVVWSLSSKDGFIIPESDDGDNGFLFIYTNIKQAQVNNTERMATNVFGIAMSWCSNPNGDLENYSDIVKTIEQHPAWANSEQGQLGHEEAWSLLMQSCSFNNNRIAKYLISKMVPNSIRYKDSNGWDAFLLSCRYHNLEMVKWFVEDFGIDINDKNIWGDTGLHLCCGKNGLDFQIMEYLIFKGIDYTIKNNKGNTPDALLMVSAPELVGGGKEHHPFYQAVEQRKRMDALPPPYKSPVQIEKEKIDRFEIKELLQIANWFKSGQTDNISLFKFWNACQDGNSRYVEYCINNGININAKTGNGCDGLFLAIDEGYNQTAEILLKSGANPNTKTNDGRSPFLICCSRGSINLISLFISLGVDINMRSVSGWTGLHLACYWGEPRTIELLLKNNADFTIKNEDGKTALDMVEKNFAYKNDIMEIFKPYIELKERINRLPPPYKSPAQIAQEKIDNFEIKELSLPQKWFKLSYVNPESEYIKEIQKQDLQLTSEAKEYVKKNKVYHATFEVWLNSIMEKGLLAYPPQTNWGEWSEWGYVYLTKTPQLAKGWMEDLWKDEDNPLIDNVVVLEVAVPNPNKIDYDAGEGFKYKGDIPPQYLKPVFFYQQKNRTQKPYAPYLKKQKKNWFKLAQRIEHDKKYWLWNGNLIEVPRGEHHFMMLNSAPEKYELSALFVNSVMMNLIYKQKDRFTDQAFQAFNRHRPIAITIYNNTLSLGLFSKASYNDILDLIYRIAHLGYDIKNIEISYPQVGSFKTYPLEQFLSRSWANPS